MLSALLSLDPLLWTSLLPLNPSTLAEVRVMFGAVLEATESRKHQANDDKHCFALGWVSTTLAVNSYGAWGREVSVFLA